MSADWLNKPNDQLEQSLITHLPKIRGFISGRVKQPQDVDDLVQETVFRTLRSADRSGVINPFAYAVQVAKTVIIEHWRNSTKFEKVEVSEDVSADSLPSLESNQLNQGKLAALSEIVDKMPALRREVFIRRRLEGQSREEIAEALELSVDAVKKHINRALVDVGKGMEKRGWSE